MTDRSSLGAALILTGLIVLLSLSPFEGWRWSPDPPWAFLWAPAHRYVTIFDQLVNLLAYVPLGLAWAQAGPGRTARQSVVWSMLICGLLSLSMECLQSYLPMRRASRLDLIWNLTGAGLGGLTWYWAHDRARHWGLRLAQWGLGQGWAQPLLQPSLRLGLVLLVWFLALAAPSQFWLSLGDLWPRGWGISPALFRPDATGLVGVLGPTERIVMEASLVALALSSFCLVVEAMAVPEASAREGLALGRLLLSLLVGTLVSRLIWSWVLTPAQTDLSSWVGWLSPGSQAGILLATLLVGALGLLPVLLRRVLGLLALFLLTLLSSGLHESALALQPLSLWSAGNWLSLRGLAWVCAMAWPVLAMMLLGAQLLGSLLGRPKIPS